MNVKSGGKSCIVSEEPNSRLRIVRVVETDKAPSSFEGAEFAMAVSATPAIHCTCPYLNNAVCCGSPNYGMQTVAKHGTDRKR